MRGWSASGLRALGWSRSSLGRTDCAEPRRHSSTAALAAWAVQLLLGDKKIESTVRYLGAEVDNALAIAEQGDV
jgi:hypothetical protein